MQGSPRPLGAYSLGFHTQNKVPIIVSNVNKDLCCIGGTGSRGFFTLPIYSHDFH